MRTTLLAIGLTLISGALARADDKQICRGASPGSDTLRVAQVIGRDARVNFIANGDENARTRDCPSANAVCKRNGFVVAGDTVLVDEIEGAYACVTYVSARGTQTSGWLPKTSLDIAKPVAPGLADWAGKWQRVEANIEIKVRGAELEAGGDATYGAFNPERVRSGGVNLGEFGGKAKPRGNVLAIGEGYDGDKFPQEDKSSFDCRVRLRLLGPYLVVEDNRNCGGHNVSFDGVYFRPAK